MNINPLSDHPGFHVWIFNHPCFYGVGDQLHFLFKYFHQLGANITCGRQPSVERCNIVIENFDRASAHTVKTFCRNYGKSVSIVLTEHLDIVRKNPLLEFETKTLYSSEIFLHGKPVISDFTYLSLPVLLERSNHLLALSECTTSYFRLGDLPEMKGFEYLVNNGRVDTLWFPKLDPAYTIMPEVPQYDFIFLGALTPFRKSVIDRLEQLNFTFAPTKSGISVKKRHFLFKQARFCLNIPQDETWPWLSPMRIISALQAGVPTLSIGTNDSSAIRTCVKQVPSIKDAMGVNQIRELLASHTIEAQRALKAYEELVETGNTLTAPLLKNFNSWALTDNLL